MEIETRLYPYGKREAKQLEELDQWTESFRANVSCAREIEEAIRTYGDGESGALCREAAQSILDRWGFKRTTFVLANTLREEGSYGRFLSEENRQWQKEQYLPSDHENRYFTVDTAGVFLDAFIGQVREAYKALNLLGPEHCQPDSFSSLDYEGKVLVLSPDVLKESYWNEHAMLWYAHDGFGCSPHAIGRSIRCTCLGNGEMTRWNRADFIGALEDRYLPDWAVKKLAELKSAEQSQSSHPDMGEMTMK